jgi:hypothetical protein
MAKKSKFDFWVSVIYPKCSCCWTVDCILTHALGRHSDGGGTELTNKSGKRVFGNRDLDWLFKTKPEAMKAAKKLVAALRTTDLPFVVRVTDYRAYNAYQAKQPPPPKLRVGKIYDLKELQKRTESAPEPKEIFLVKVTQGRPPRAKTAKR